MPITTRRHKRNGVRQHKKRTEVAVQAILPLGFSRDLISDTIQHLLQVYGGQESWTFIEEETYKLVIESILRKDETCFPKAADDLDGRESNAEHIDIDLANVKLNEDRPLPKENTKLEGETAKVDKTFIHHECGYTEQVSSIENQLYDNSISNGSLTITEENKFESLSDYADFADGDGTLTHKRETGIFKASDAEFGHCSFSQAKEVSRDVGLKTTEPLDNTPDSIKAEVASQKELCIGKIKSASLEPALGCNFSGNNSWECAGINKIQNSKLASSQEGIEQRDNVDTRVLLHALTLPEAEKSEKNEKGEESNKYGKGLGEKQCLCDITKDVSSYFYSSGKPSEQFVNQTTTVFSLSQNAVTNSCLTENVLQGACQMVPEQVADQISKGRGYTNSTCITLLPSIKLQRQEVPFYTSNLYHSLHRNSSMPLKRKACFGWLSDEENSPESSDTERLSNDDFGKGKEIGSNALETSQGICLIDRDSLEKNKKLEKNIIFSNGKQLSDKFSSEYNYRGAEEGRRRFADHLFQPWTSIVKDMGDQCNRDKYEQTEAGKSVEKTLAKPCHKNEMNDEENWKFRKLEMGENIGGSRFIKTSHKKQSFHEQETQRFDHRNSRIDGKHSWQLTNNDSSYNKKTSYHSWEDYQRGEPRKNDLHNQTIIKQHLEQGISNNQQENCCQGHHRQEYKRNSENVKIISCHEMYTDHEGYGRQNYGGSMNLTGKSSLLHEKKGFQYPKNAHNHHHGNGKDGDKFHSPHMSVALPHTQFRNDSDPLPPKKHSKMRGWDVKPDFMKRR